MGRNYHWREILGRGDERIQNVLLFIYVGLTLSQKGFKGVETFRTVVKSDGNCSHGPVTSTGLSFFSYKWEQPLPSLPGGSGW